MLSSLTTSIPNDDTCSRLTSGLCKSVLKMGAFKFKSGLWAVDVAASEAESLSTVLDHV